MLFLFVTVHESGHLLAGWLTGGHVREIALLSVQPHVRILGNSSPRVEAVRSAAGSGLSLLAAYAFLLFAPAAWFMARDTATAFGCIELLGWTLSSLTGAHNPNPDDAEHFLAISGASPYAVVAVCAALGCIGFLIIRRTEMRRRTCVEAAGAQTPPLLVRSASASTSLQ